MELRGSLVEAGRELKGSSEKITDSLSFELQKWFSNQNWLDFCQEFISELHFAPAGSLQLRAVLACSRELGALLETRGDVLVVHLDLSVVCPSSGEEKFSWA